MKKFYLIVAAVLILGCNRQYQDRHEIAGWTMRYTKAIREADIEKLMSCFVDNIVFLPPNQSQFYGKEDLRKWFLTYFNYYNPSETVSSRDIKVSGDMAYALCKYSISVRVKYSSEEFRDDGKLINLFRRQPNGQWKCTHSIWNSNNPTIDLHAQIPGDFSGTWKLDVTRSTVISELISSKIFIVQRGNEISMNRSYELDNKDPLINSFNFTIGEESKSNFKDGTNTAISFWSPDKQSFTINEKIISGKNEYTRTTTYTLTARGETLNIYSDGTLPNGLIKSINNGHIELVYIRQ